MLNILVLTPKTTKINIPYFLFIKKKKKKKKKILVKQCQNLGLRKPLYFVDKDFGWSKIEIQISSLPFLGV